MHTRSAAIQDLLHAERDFAAEGDRIIGMVERYKRSDGTRLIDLGCGTGRHLEYLRTHFTVEGLDLDRGMVEVAAARLPGVPLHVGSFTDLDLPRRYGVILCLMGSIGYVRWPGTLDRTIRLMAAHAQPGGIVVVEPWIPPEQTGETLISTRVAESPGIRVTRMRTSRVEDGASVLYFDYLVTTADGIDNFAERHELGIFSHQQYLAAFTGAGLETRYELSGPSGSPAYVGVKG
ncbi:MAG TPA: class I SAM-dependent methyltransferase [Chloroflexota bacterium]|nr:class I SAM-dependent methyltransferase [Chloroflexota bacterium]